MTTEQFFEMVDIAKNMKKDYIRINANIIMGTDASLNSLSVICTDKAFDNYSEVLIYGKNELAKYLKTAEEPKMIRGNLISKSNEVFSLESRYLNYHIREMYKNCLNIEKECKVIYSNDNLRADNTFEDCISLKSADGATLYKIKTDSGKFLGMSIFNGLLPVNKTDSVELIVYDTDPLSYVAKFTIRKKKNINIQSYYRFRYI